MDLIFKKYNNDAYVKTHIGRFKKTIEYLKPYVKNNMNILNIGGEGNLISELLNSTYENIYVENTECDIRYKLVTNKEKYDLIISLEVIEHLKDRDSSHIPALATQTNSGIWNFFVNCNRLLNEKGLLFVTTPNMNSYCNLYNLINYDNPNFFKPHPKELSKNEIMHFNSTCNFKIIKYDTFNVWGRKAEEQKIIKEIIKIFKSSNNNLINDRNEDIFCISEKIKDLENKHLNIKSGLKKNILKSINGDLITYIEGKEVHEKL
jgi:predicted SAM-dependent methyltransferase